MNHQTQQLQISGITCDACIKLITRRFSKIEGVSQVVAVDKNGMVEVQVESLLPSSAYEKVLSETPYTVVRVE